ncbi:MAG: carbohydrate ABC transporter permease [Ardenticatenaceae bacterium]|nr:carbohydrate ABC transporter permease [Anaerolineales bacterium]MCB8940758.1 carbohydrate ABC transporter permease [Ardenticatenaceae bacterium]MCB8972097.1 carbohydrate ABC transporter permease [Ardenticatenaceae bacterium]
MFSKLEIGDWRFWARLAVAVIFLLPIFWLITAALHPVGRPLPTTLSPSLELTLANFRRVWQLVPMGRFMLNSLLVVSLAVPITLVTSSWAGFGMAQLPKASQRRWIVLSLAVLMVPGVALWASRFFIYTRLGLYDTILALIAPAFMGSSPFFVLMFYRAFRRIPTAIYEAARLEGAGVLASWWQIGLPIARPTAVGVALLTFVLYWGDFVSPLLYLRSQSRYTLPIALQLLQQLTASDWPLLMAGVMLATMIPIGLFLLLQPYFARMGS